MRALDIAILTSGRFHVLDLARELEALGHRVTFLSLLPPWRLPRRGLSATRGRWLGWGAAPFFVAQRAARAAPPTVRDRLADLTRLAIDHTAALRLPKVDVLIAMAGMGLETVRAAKRAGALTILERSSAHIDEQLALLSLPASSSGVTRERTEYATVDLISIPSRHVEASFLSRGFSPSRLILNPLGVDLDEFPHTRSAAAPDAPLEVLFAGTFSRQKGCDLLLAAARALPEVRFTTVGPDGDLPREPAPNLTHHAAVPQRELTRFYAAADVLCLPSRQDGFGMVMTQALASGCHVLGTDRTGAPDLAALCGADAVSVVPAADPEALIAALRALATTRRDLRARRADPAPWRADLSWGAYARRYQVHLERALASR